MRFVAIAVGALSLMGCAQVIERQMKTHTGVSSIQGLDLFATESALRCTQANTKRCIEVVDWLEQREPTDTLTLEFSLSIGENSFSSTQTLDVQPQHSGAPVMLLFPGYGMPSVGLGFMAEYFRAKGFHPLVMPSPTEQQPFSFGVHSAHTMAMVIEEEYSDRRVYAYGFSMGSLAVAEFHQHYPLHGAILAAPMLDFNASADFLMNMYRQNSFVARVLPMRSYQKALQQMITSSQIDRNKLDWPYAAAYLPDNTIIIGSQADKISRFSDLANEVERQQRPFTLAELDEPYMIHPFMALPVEAITQPISEWLSAQSQLSYQPQSPTHGHGPVFGRSTNAAGEAHAATARSRHD